ncbi:MAG: DM13 domain-containing protein [Hyphomicrobiaceae bacterium]
MRKWLAVAFLAGAVLGAIAGAGGMLIAFPFLFPPPVVAERAPDAAAASQVGTFKFDEQAPGRDLVHWANGSGGVFRMSGSTVIRFGDDFQAGPGPNYWIYLNTVPVGDSASFKADKGRVRIAQLKSFTGGQNYVLPPGTELGRFHTVTIWCESFSVYIGSAVLPKS